MFKKVKVFRPAIVFHADLVNDKIVDLKVRAEKRRSYGAVDLFMSLLFSPMTCSINVKVNDNPKLANLYRFAIYAHNCMSNPKHTYLPFSPSIEPDLDETIRFKDLAQFQQFLNGWKNNFRDFGTWLSGRFYIVSADMEIMVSEDSMKWSCSDGSDITPAKMYDVM